MDRMAEHTFATDARQRTARRGRWLQYLTIGWNSAEFVVALVAGFLGGSVALIGFGFDSAIEVTSAVAALWRLRCDADAVRREPAERLTLRVIGACFLLLASYVTFDAIWILREQRAPRHLMVGIVLATLSLVVMPALVHYKRRIATMLGSGALEAEARQTQVCAYLSAILLAGLGLNAWLGWWWADPLAGLLMAPVIAWGGIEVVRGRTGCGD
jgi:divalent metal cation (Fe/Co/Zn/Cd) transporter